MQLKDRVALITGGRRVGSRLALELGRRGMHVALTYFSSRDIIDQTAADLCSLGVRAITLAADLRDPAQAERCCEEVYETLGSLDVLVNMVSTFPRTPWDEVTPAAFDETLRANLHAPFYAAWAAAQVMRRQPIVDGLQGKMVNFADWAVDRPYRHFAPYLIAKGGVVTMTKTLAVELAPTITVNAVAPAMIDPPPHLSADDIAAIRHASPLERIGCPADANNLVLYLLEGTDFTTGNIYRIDGGRFLGHPAE